MKALNAALTGATGRYVMLYSFGISFSGLARNAQREKHVNNESTYDHGR